MRLRIYIIVLILAGAFPVAAHAQSVGVEIQPELSTVYVKPGSTIKIPIVVKNTGNQGSFIAEGVALQPQGNQGSMVQARDLPRGISIETLANEPFFLPTGAEKKLEMTITIDPLLAPRDYYLATQVTSVGKKRSEGKSSIAIDLSAFSTVLLTITNDGNMNISGYINSLTTGKDSNVRFFDSTQAIPLDLIMHNSGDNWMYTSGTIAISDMFGNMELIQIPQQRVLAGTKRLVRSLQTTTPQHTAILSGMHMGKYTVTARMAVEGKNTMPTKTITFIAFPFRLIGALSLLGILATVIGARANRPAQQRQVHPHRL